jgi:F420H(2)-dependent quinone reductase
MATRPGWQVTAIRQAAKLAVWLYRRSGGAIGGKIRGAPVLLLTTTGRKTGRIWTTPLIYGRDDDRLVLIGAFAGNDRHPAWWLNLRGNKRGTVQLGTDTFDVVPREADGEERERLWAKMVQIYRGYDGYATKTTRRLPVVVLERA